MPNSVSTPCAALDYLTGSAAEDAFTLPHRADAAFPSADDLETVLQASQAAHGCFAGLDGDTDRRRLVNMAFALAATLPDTSAPLRCPMPMEGTLFARLYPDRAAREPLLAVIDHLEQLRHTCDAFPDGTFHLEKASGGILHFQRIGPQETTDIITNRTARILVEPVGQKMTEVNPFGFTITVQENGHCQDHSYYDIV